MTTIAFFVYDLHARNEPEDYSNMLKSLTPKVRMMQKVVQSLNTPLFEWKYSFHSSSLGVWNPSSV